MPGKRPLYPSLLCLRSLGTVPDCARTRLLPAQSGPVPRPGPQQRREPLPARLWRLPRFPPVPARESAIPPAESHSPPKTPLELHPGVRPSRFLPARVASSWLHAGCHAPATAVQTTSLPVDLSTSGPLPLPAPDNTPHAPGGRPPALHLRRAPLAHTRELSRASRGGAPLPPARSAVTNSCR